MMLVTYGKQCTAPQIYEWWPIAQAQTLAYIDNIPSSNCEVLEGYQIHHKNQLNGLQHNIPPLQRDRKENENAPIIQTRLTSPCPNSTPAQRTSNFEHKTSKDKRQKDMGLHLTIAPLQHRRDINPPIMHTWRTLQCPNSQPTRITSNFKHVTKPTKQNARHCITWELTDDSRWPRLTFVKTGSLLMIVRKTVADWRGFVGLAMEWGPSVGGGGRGISSRLFECFWHLHVLSICWHCSSHPCPGPCLATFARKISSCACLKKPTCVDPQRILAKPSSPSINRLANFLRGNFRSSEERNITQILQHQNTRTND